MGHIITYEDYHNLSMKAKDVDPAVTCLKYLADRFELNMEQRYWIAYLYGTNYCAPTTFYIYNEFPDYECIDINRVNKWWKENKHKLIFQSDRLRIKSNDQFVESLISYKGLAKSNQQNYFKSNNWKEIYQKIEAIKYFGRFSTFNYLDVLNAITDINYKPTYLNIAEAKSCRNGLCYAIGKDDWVDKDLTKKTAEILHKSFVDYLKKLEGNVFQIETTLCAYKKYRWEKRYIGFYIDRMYKEIRQMEINVPGGVAWETLWQFRNETFEKKYLTEAK